MITTHGIDGVWLGGDTLVAHAQANGVIMGRTQASSDPQGGFNKDMTQLAELKRVGFSLQELRDVGFSPAVLRTAGYSMQEVSASVKRRLNTQIKFGDSRHLNS